MTKFFLVYQKEKDQYHISTMGLGYRYQHIYRKPEMSDDEFKQEAIRQFDAFVAKEQIIEGEIIKTGYVF